MEADPAQAPQCFSGLFGLGDPENGGSLSLGTKSIKDKIWELLAVMFSPGG